MGEAISQIAIACGSRAQEPLWFSKLHIWGLISREQVLKVGTLDVRMKPSVPQGEAQGCEFPPSWWWPGLVGLW